MGEFWFRLFHGGRSSAAVQRAERLEQVRLEAARRRGRLTRQTRDELSLTTEALRHLARSIDKNGQRGPPDGENSDI